MIAAAPIAALIGLNAQPGLRGRQALQVVAGVVVGVVIGEIVVALALVRREFAGLREELAAALDTAAQALRDGDRARAEEALVRVDATDEDRLREELNIARTRDSEAVRDVASRARAGANAALERDDSSGVAVLPMRSPRSRTISREAPAPATQRSGLP